MKLNIVLIEPEIPQNTGNIVRTCAATGAILHLIKPLGFSVDDKYLKRAGLDYWKSVKIKYYENLEEFFQKNLDGKFFFMTTKAVKLYTKADYRNKCYLVFGKETKGLPLDLLNKNKESTIRIPMNDNIRSLNLSNAVSIIVYEALRQNDFNGLIIKGDLSFI